MAKMLLDIKKNMHCSGLTRNVNWLPYLPLSTLSSLPLPFLPLFCHLPLPLEVGHLISSQEVWERAVSSPSRVWRGAAAKIKFGAIRALKYGMW